MKVFTAISFTFLQIQKALIIQWYGYRDNGYVLNHFVLNKTQTNSFGNDWGESRKQSCRNPVICKNIDMIGSTIKEIQN